MIEKYSFGSITIDGQTYHYDVEVRGGGKVLKWQRAASHIIDVADVTRAVEQNPSVIIIGTGESGVAQVTEAAQNLIKEKNIELIIDWTAAAIDQFNQRQKTTKNIIGLFHLTC